MRICKVCKKNFKALWRDVKRGRYRTCSRSCSTKLKWREGKCKGLSGEKNPHWKGGLTQSSKGYWYVLMPDHPRAKKGYVKQADLILEKKLGRGLRKGEIAHHINENKEDDSPGNLELKLTLDHTRQHIQKRAEEARKRNPNSRWLRAKQPEHPNNRSYKWPADKALLEMRRSMSLRMIARKIGCSHKVVDRRIKRINGVHWSER